MDGGHGDSPPKKASGNMCANKHRLVALQTWEEWHPCSCSVVDVGKSGIFCFVGMGNTGLHPLAVLQLLLSSA